MTTTQVELYTDGSCLRNPGAGGYAFIIRYYIEKEGSELPDIRTVEKNQGYRLTTNNRMEIMAGIFGLREIISMIQSGTLQGTSQVNLFSDSEYLCNAINHKWIYKWQSNNWMTSGFQGSQPTPVKNKDLWEQVLEVLNQLQNLGIMLTISHVKGHAGDEFNEKADKLAVAASSGYNHITDEVYEKSIQMKNSQR